MPTPRLVSVPRPEGVAPIDLPIVPGTPLVIVGANGAGKTRLGVYLEEQLPPRTVIRLAAHKSLAVDDKVTLISLDRAGKALLLGHPDFDDENMKVARRWNKKPATHLLRDFPALLQVLFAQHNNIAVNHLKSHQSDARTPAPTTHLDRLAQAWTSLLPHRRIEIQETSLLACPTTPGGSSASYAASELSDGERVIIYFLGHVIVASNGSTIIIDEPEQHVHKALLGTLWDTLEHIRPDCSFVYITHDLDFLTRHSASNKYFLRAYQSTPQSWDIAAFPIDPVDSDRIFAEVAGSRKPVLFIEGSRDSLDLTLYRHHYSSYTLIPVGSCDTVIRSVASYKASMHLHRVAAFGLVDADDRSLADIVALHDRGVAVLPVCEIENLLLMPPVFTAIAEALSCPQPASLVTSMVAHVMSTATTHLELVCTRHAIRTIDRNLKALDVAAKDRLTLQANYSASLANIDIATIFAHFESKLRDAITRHDAAAVLAMYDNKGLLAKGASLLGITGPRDLVAKVGQLLHSAAGREIANQLGKVLPAIPA